MGPVGHGTRSGTPRAGVASPLARDGDVPPAQRTPTVDEAPQRTEASEAYVQEIHRSLTSISRTFALAHLADRTLRPRGIAPSSLRGAVLTGIAGASLRMLVPLAVTAVASDGMGAPLWRWLVVAVALGFGDVVFALGHAPTRYAEQQAGTALVPLITREADLRELAAFVRRWYRLRVSVPVAMLIAAGLLFACFLAAPEGVRELPIGSVAMLALLFYEIGEVAFWSLYSLPYFRRQGNFEHNLFWASPVDSMAVQKELRAWAIAQNGAGIMVTIYLVLALVIVSLDSPLLLPVALGVVVTGYLTTFVSMVAVRSAVRRIVQRIRDEQLAVLQQRLGAYGTRAGELTSREADDVSKLLTLHHLIRDTPTSPRSAQTLVHAVTALLVPTLAFLIAVLSEVYAERLLDQLLP